MVHKGIVRILPSRVLDWLQFSPGEMLDARVDTFGVLELCISHWEMPEVKEGERIPIVIPAYARYEDNQGHWVAIRQPLGKY